jgi:ferredoxin
MATINTALAAELQKYGAKDFSLCFNCGNCTAVCNLTQRDVNFPRKYVRSGILGQTEEILSSRELWLCYACGECGESCPRQAAPDEYMSALRRYAIASYEPTGLTRLLFKNNVFSIFITLLLAFILGFYLLTGTSDVVISRWIFRYIPFEVIHDTGMIIFMITGLSIIIGTIRMILGLRKNMTKPKEKKNFLKSLPVVFKRIGDELATMKRYRECDADDEFWNSKSSIQRPWFVHWSIMWGFLGLLLATTLDFIFKDPATTIWLPSRILGTIAGLFLMYGASLALLYRIKKVTKSYLKTKLADWMFIIFLWLAGFTGFWLEISVSFSADYPVNHIVFLIHTVISMELVLLFAFSKFAHAIYRPVALFFHYLSEENAQ